ncbi:hypothetical protein OsI_24340 [Oryza sativa Indica Group]|uniref:Uncharacterized protein n=1 Tax=Oryza sativa subsp. indica TaxID=39946 RepID=A2YGN0_ORYSI|nr:hypothetical protein OsI_24340 [Oryza sativa Indica Group]
MRMGRDVMRQRLNSCSDRHEEGKRCDEAATGMRRRELLVDAMHCLYVLSWGGLGLDYEGLVRVIPTMEVTVIPFSRTAWTRWRGAFV